MAVRDVATSRTRGSRPSRGGAFVNMLSVASWAAYPVAATYSASKAAAWSYTNAARQQLKTQGT
ncbi:SDR family NAD(P)-dependent oxidoreductase [Streptomyces caniscabiei]|uniref:SDR family NAD(P)-dependent oxidoreductase n=1 Tax=Streptomyces caniscabiei TaxID=2746961 RepID=UPI000B30ED92